MNLQRPIEHPIANTQYPMAKEIRGHAPGNLIRFCLLAVWLVLAAGCGSPPKVVRQDPELERNAALASGAFAGGSAEKAAAYYRKALDRARLMDEAAAIGRNAYNLAACLVLLNRDAEAGSLLDEAEAELKRAGVNAREIPLLRARIARRAGKNDEALALVQAQLKAPLVKDQFTLQYRILLADLLCAKGDAAGATAELGRVSRKDLAAESATVQADASRVRARIALLEKNPREAGKFLDTAAQQFRQGGQYLEMALALDEAGQAYEAAGDLPAALERDYRAARSLFLAGQLDRAARPLTSGLRLADQAGAMELRDKFKKIEADIKSARSVSAP